jgi:hypothetical protein
MRQDATRAAKEKMKHARRVDPGTPGSSCRCEWPTLTSPPHLFSNPHAHCFHHFQFCDRRRSKIGLRQTATSCCMRLASLGSVKMAERDNADSAVGRPVLMVTKIEDLHSTSSMQVIPHPGRLVSVMQPHGRRCPQMA